MNDITIFPAIGYESMADDLITYHKMSTWVVFKEQNGNYVKSFFYHEYQHRNSIQMNIDVEKYLLNRLFTDIYKMAVFGTYDRSLTLSDGTRAFVDATEHEVKKAIEQPSIIYK